MRSHRSAVVLALAVVLTLGAALSAAQRLSPTDVNKLPSKPADARISYGPDPLQFGELRLPRGTGPFPLAVVIHGGCWLSRWTLQNTSALADALRDAGIATWNIEYRRLDNPGGGWPGTFTDVADAVDRVRFISHEHPIDLSRVVTIGHSSGAHLALWAAARGRLTKGSQVYRATPLPLKAAVALGGPGDLRDFYGQASRICGANVIDQLMGGDPETVAARYAQGSPAELLPLGVRQVLIVGVDDGVMPPKSREAYRTSAAKAGDAIEVIEVFGGHFEVIAPTSAAWPAVRDKMLALTK